MNPQASIGSGQIRELPTLGVIHGKLGCATIVDRHMHDGVVLEGDCFVQEASNTRFQLGFPYVQDIALCLCIRHRVRRGKSDGRWTQRIREVRDQISSW